MQINPDQLIRSLSDSTRLRLVALLSERRELCVCELKDALELAQPKVSRHLAVLRESGVLVDRRDGLWIYYRLNPHMPAWAARALVAVHDGCHGSAPYRKDLERLDGTCCGPENSCTTNLIK